MTRVACAQLDVVYNDPDANASRALGVLADCKADGASLVVFPECFLTGYCVGSREEAEALALPVPIRPDGQLGELPPPLAVIRDWCASNGVHAVVGYAGRDETGLYNGAALFTSEGSAFGYAKTHLPELGYDKHVVPGDALPVFETPLGRIGLLVCFDLRHPEAARTLALRGADLIVLPTNWPQGAGSAPAFIAATRAAENRVFLATCDRVGTENGFSFIGLSGIYDPVGKTLARAGAGEEVITADLDLAQARCKRNVIVPGLFETDVVGSRRPELYGPLLDR